MTPPRKKKVKVKTSVELCEQNHAQLRRIAETYHLSHNSVIAQAIAKWFHSDAAVQQEKKKHVSNYS